MTHFDFPLIPANTAIVLNGQPSAMQRLTANLAGDSHSYSHIVVCDGAWQGINAIVNNLDKSMVAKISVIGDGDSIQNPPNGFIKDDDQYSTDFEKALKLICEDTETTNKVVDVYWADGGELDHTFGNLAMAAKFAKHIQCRFFNDTQFYGFVDGHVKITGAKNQLLSVLPFPQVLVESSEGIRYPMSDMDMTLSTQQSLRNQISDNTAEIQANGQYFLFVGMSVGVR